MSASAKKKLRKEQQAAKLEQKQQKEKKEARQQKIGTTIFVVAIAVILIAAIVIGVTSIVGTSGIVEKNTVAATVGDHQINAVEASFYYTDTITNAYNSWVNAYGDSMELYMMFMGLDLSQPLDKQPHPEDETKTWADYFADEAMNRAKSDYTLADMAIAAGHKLTDEEQLELDNGIESLSLIALYSGYEDVGAYLYANYGPGADMEAYKEYCTRSSLATSYYNAHKDTLTYDAAAMDAYQAGKELDYTSFNYASYYVSANAYMTGGTTDENGAKVYNEEEKAAGRIAAEAVAKQLAENTTVDALDKAIAALPVNAETPDAASTYYRDALYTSISSTLAPWLSDASRVNGDTTVIPLESTADGVTTISGYYVVLFENRNENNRPLANIRHLLVNFVSESASSTYTDAEKAAAKTEAEKILQEMLDEGNGVITDEAFAAKAKAMSDDNSAAANSGLYADITPVHGIYEDNFTDWAIDPNRKPGDVGIIDTAYGYHIMYYVGDSDLTYRQHLIREDMLEEDMNEWYNGILDAAELTVLDLSSLNTSLVLGK